MDNAIQHRKLFDDCLKHNFSNKTVKYIENAMREVILIPRAGLAHLARTLTNLIAYFTVVIVN